MPRPAQTRLLDQRHRTLYYKPCGRIPDGDKKVSIRFEELEALRLADLEGLNQTEAARHMGVSRHTFGRLLAAARKKSAEALVNAMPLEVTGAGTHAFRVASDTFLKENRIMKIAVSAEGPELGDPVDPRFGRAAGFIVYDLDNGTSVYLDNGAAQLAAQGAGIAAAELVANAGAEVVLSGYVGPKAFDALIACGIGVVQDADNRTVGETIEAFRAGQYTVLTQKEAEA